MQITFAFTDSNILSFECVIESHQSSDYLNSLLVMNSRSSFSCVVTTWSSTPSAKCNVYSLILQVKYKKSRKTVAHSSSFTVKWFDSLNSHCGSDGSSMSSKYSSRDFSFLKKLSVPLWSSGQFHFQLSISKRTVSSTFPAFFDVGLRHKIARLVKLIHFSGRWGASKPCRIAFNTYKESTWREMSESPRERSPRNSSFI